MRKLNKILQYFAYNAYNDEIQSKDQRCHGLWLTESLIKVIRGSFIFQLCFMVRADALSVHYKLNIRQA